MGKPLVAPPQTTSNEATLPSAPARGRTRHTWVDTAKAISILLVVLWHTVADQWIVNELLLYLRMPLFFFVAGFFAAKSLDADWKYFLKNKFGHFLYLYVFWCLISFVLVKAPGALKDGDPIPLRELLAIFVDPPLTLWFIYGLALVFLLMKIFRKVNFGFLLVSLTLIYFWSVADGEWRDVSFVDRIARLSPFFLLGTVSFVRIDALPGRYDALSLLLLPAYFALSYGIHQAEWQMFGPLTLTATAVGIAGILLFSRLVQGLWIGTALNFIGRRTLLIYVLAQDHSGVCGSGLFPFERGNRHRSGHPGV